jgi:hypothetical protein
MEKLEVIREKKSKQLHTQTQTRSWQIFTNRATKIITAWNHEGLGQQTRQ